MQDCQHATEQEKQGIFNNDYYAQDEVADEVYVGLYQSVNPASLQ